MLWRISHRRRKASFYPLLLCFKSPIITPHSKGMVFDLTSKGEEVGGSTSPDHADFFSKEAVADFLSMEHQPILHNRTTSSPLTIGSLPASVKKLAMEKKANMPKATKEKKMIKGSGLLTSLSFNRRSPTCLAWETQKDVLRKHFDKYSEILEVVIISDKITGRSKGYSFVTFKEVEAAKKVCGEALWLNYYRTDNF